jgi:hypothetical protein
VFLISRVFFINSSFSNQNEKFLSLVFSSFFLFFSLFSSLHFFWFRQNRGTEKRSAVVECDDGIVVECYESSRGTRSREDEEEEQQQQQHKRKHKQEEDE